MKTNTHIAFVFITLAFYLITSCNSAKYVAKGDYLLEKNKVIVDDKNTYNLEVTDLIIQRPNQTSLGLPLQLYFYNMGNVDYENTPKKWTDDHPKTSKVLNSVFSKKQTRNIGESYKKINEWLLTKGEAPIALDVDKAEKSAEKLRTHYFNQGYFDAKTSYQVDLKIKKAEVNYFVTKNDPYFLDTIRTAIESKVIDSIYNKYKLQSFLNSGKRYRDIDFRMEANRLTTLFRNSGIYHFTENLIGFYEIDTLNPNHKTNVLLKINNRVSEKEGEVITHPLKIQRITKVGVFTDYNYNQKDEDYHDTIHYKGFSFFAHDKIKYRPKALSNAIFMEPNQIYKDSARDLTRNHLKQLKNFKLVKLRYQEINDEELYVSIVLTPLKKYSIGLNTEAIHSNIKQLGFSGGFSVLNRNTFKGAEIFKLSFQGSIFDIANKVGNNTQPFSSWEIGTDASLEIPRIFLPFNISKLIPKSKYPKTLISLGTSFQKNIGLDKQKFTGTMDLSWQSSPTKKHNVELINTQYVKNLNTGSYFDIYSSEYEKLKTIQETYFPNEEISTTTALNFINQNITGTFQNSNPDEYQTAKNIEKRNTIITTNYVSPSISYAYTYNNQLNISDNDYLFFKAKIATSGNLTSAITQTSQGDIKTFLDIPIAQFARVDFEFKKFWRTSASTQLAYRTFLGAAIPYGNSDEIPFANSYFIGGSNDLRAWKTYDLGPGANKTGLEFNVGNFKFLSSLEYRFNITSSLKSALFIDAGNIWDITNSTLTAKNEKFTGLQSLENIAVGSGFGFRYDFSFLILRLDLGFKTYEPYLENKWFQNYNFNNSVLNIGINYPF